MGKADAAKIVDLKRVLSERFPNTVSRAPVKRVVATGLECLDGPLGGGLPLGEVIEIVAGAPCSGTGLLLLTLLQRVLAEQPCVALVDGSDSFDPADLSPKFLQRLLWVRCPSAKDSLRPVDALLRDGNITLVIFDLRGNCPTELRDIPQHAWFRFQRVAQAAGTVLLVLAVRPSACGVRWRLRMESHLGIDALERKQIETLRSLRLELVRGRGGLLQTAG